jgi:hypothetical protein
MTDTGRERNKGPVRRRIRGRRRAGKIDKKKRRRIWGSRKAGKSRRQSRRGSRQE